MLLLLYYLMFIVTLSGKWYLSVLMTAGMKLRKVTLEDLPLVCILEQRFKSRSSHYQTESFHSNLQPKKNIISPSHIGTWGGYNTNETYMLTYFLIQGKIIISLKSSFKYSKIKWYFLSKYYVHSCIGPWVKMVEDNNWNVVPFDSISKQNWNEEHCSLSMTSGNKFIIIHSLSHWCSKFGNKTFVVTLFCFSGTTWKW